MTILFEEIKRLRIKISEKSLTQRFDVSMTSFSSEKNKKYIDELIYTR